MNTNIALGTKKKAAVGMGMSAALADSVFSWANIAGILSLGVGVVAACAIFISANVKERAFKLELAEASARVDEAQAKIAKANEAIATANAGAAQARLEQEKLKAQLAWRTIPTDVANHLIANLVTKPGSVNIQFVASDTEAKYLAFQIERIFSKAGWRVAMSSISMHGVMIFGLWVPDSKAADLGVIRSALKNSALAFAGETEKFPQADSIGSGSSIDGAAIIFVGSKMPPN